MLAFTDVVVTPYTELLLAGPLRLVHRGGPSWPDFDAQDAARHRRAGANVDDEPEPRPAESRLSGTWAWAGPISSHFGHQLVEFSMRLIPTLAHDPDARFLFAVPPSGRYGTIDAAPAFVRAILEWCGVPPARCHVATAPLLVPELVVAPQAEQLGGPGADDAHLDRMDELTRRRLGPVEQRGTVYVSRAGLPARFAGESALEEALRKCGVLVIRPETMSLPEQLQSYASAGRLIFAEGSALYGPLLLGRCLGDVTVLARRPQSRLARPLLLSRSRSLRYHDVVKELLPGRNWRGDVVNFAGMTILDDEALLETFDAIDVPLRDHWDASAYAECRDADIRRHRGTD